MKKIRLFLFAILGIAGAFALYSFAPKQAKKKTWDVRTFYYKMNVNDQRIEPGITIPGVEHSITESSFTNVNNWSESFQGAELDLNPWDGATYLNSIWFRWEETADGTSDTELTLQEALNGLWEYYEQVGNLGYSAGASLISLGAPGVWVSRADYANIP
jgi:hypothetical protein